MSTKIQKIILNVNGEEIKLSLEQAKELQKLLNETFGVDNPTFVNPYPIVIERPIRVVLPSWQIDYYYTDDDNTITFTANSNQGGIG